MVSIPEKRYFTIGEVSTLCDLKPHVLRYWEQEFTVLRPNKRRGNRRYYRREDVLLIQQIKHLLYDKGFTISGARAQLKDGSFIVAPMPPVAPVQTASPPISHDARASMRILLEEARDLLRA